MRNGNLKRKSNPWGQGTILNGYRMITVNKNQVREHRHVMEKFLGRKLERFESVHHINHDKLDNRIENLEVMTKTTHNKLHKTTTFRNKTHKQCTYCLKIKPRYLFYKRKNRPEAPKGDTNLTFCKECNTIICAKRYKAKHSLP
jgi:hypothetical protein